MEELEKQGIPCPLVVFVTAFDRYAVRDFECNALDYLLKPVHPERLAVTLQRVRNRTPFCRQATASDAVFVKTASVARFVPWSEVRHIVSEGNYTGVFLAGAPSFLMLRP